MSEHRLLLLVIASALFVPLMLFADGPGLASQLAVGAATGIFLWTAVRSASVPAIQVTVAMVIATTGELVLSLGWGLYDYRFAEIPWYVPPGHGIFYLLAAESAASRLGRTYERRFIGAVVVLGSLTAVVGLLFADDQWGALWWLATLAMMRFSGSSLLIAFAWIYTMPLEWIGTWNGNWWWLREVPGIPLLSGNPPAGVAMLYGLLDFLTVSACGAVWMRRRIEAGARPVTEG